MTAHDGAAQQAWRTGGQVRAESSSDRILAPVSTIPDSEALALIHTDPAEWVRQGEERAVNTWREAHRLPPIVDVSCKDCSWGRGHVDVVGPADPAGAG